MVEAGRQAMIAAVVKLVHILEYRHAQSGQYLPAMISIWSIEYCDNFIQNGFQNRLQNANPREFE